MKKALYTICVKFRSVEEICAYAPMIDIGAGSREFKLVAVFGLIDSPLSRCSFIKPSFVEVQDTKETCYAGRKPICGTMEM